MASLGRVQADPDHVSWTSRLGLDLKSRRRIGTGLLGGELLLQSALVLVTASSLPVSLSSFSLTPHTLQGLDGYPNPLCTPIIRPTLPPSLRTNKGLLKTLFKTEYQLNFTGFNGGAGRKWPLAKMTGDPGAEGEEPRYEPPPMEGILAAVHRNPESAPSRSQVQTRAHRLATFSMWLPRVHIPHVPPPASGTLPVSQGFLAPPCRPIHLGTGSGRVTASPGLLHGVFTPLWKVPLNLAGLSWAVVWEFRG